MHEALEEQSEQTVLVCFRCFVELVKEVEISKWIILSQRTMLVTKLPKQLEG